MADWECSACTLSQTGGHKCSCCGALKPSTSRSKRPAIHGNVPPAPSSSTPTPAPLKREEYSVQTAKPLATTSKNKKTHGKPITPGSRVEVMRGGQEHGGKVTSRSIRSKVDTLYASFEVRFFCVFLMKLCGYARLTRSPPTHCHCTEVTRSCYRRESVVHIDSVNSMNSSSLFKETGSTVDNLIIIYVANAK